MPDDITPAAQTETPDTPVATPEPAAAVPAVPTPEPVPAQESPSFDWEKGELNWEALRTRLARGDEKKLNILNRILSPEQLVDNYVTQNDKIRSGKFKSALPKDATPEQVAQWRAENDVPESPDKYDTTLSEGLVIGEADKPAVDKFLEFAHQENMSGGAVKKVLDWYFKSQTEAIAAREAAIGEMDTNWEIEAKAALKEEFGPKAQAVLNQYNAFVHDAPDGLADDLRFARMPNGQLLASDPRFIRWAAAKANELNPMASISAPAGVDPGAHLANEIAAIESKMGSSAWSKMSHDEKAALERKHSELIEIDLKRSKVA